MTFVNRSGNFDSPPPPPPPVEAAKGYIRLLIWSCQRLLLTVGVKFSCLNTCLSACNNVQPQGAPRFKTKYLGCDRLLSAPSALYYTVFDYSALIITACTEVLTVYKPRLFCHSRYLKQSQSQNKNKLFAWMWGHSECTPQGLLCRNRSYVAWNHSKADQNWGYRGTEPKTWKHWKRVQMFLCAFFNCLFRQYLYKRSRPAFLFRIWVPSGAAILVHYLPTEGWFVTYLILLPHMSVLFSTSLIHLWAQNGSTHDRVF